MSTLGWLWLFLILSILGVACFLLVARYCNHVRLQPHWPRVIALGLSFVFLIPLIQFARDIANS